MSRAAKAHQQIDLGKLERSVRWAYKNDLPRSELIAVLRPLVRHTTAATRSGKVARLQLAEQLLALPLHDRSTKEMLGSAWEAARLLHCLLPLENSSDPPKGSGGADTEGTGEPPRARQLQSDETARANAAFGLACTVLGHYRAAKRAYLRALREDPEDPVAAHNLGHLLATKLRAPLASLVWLQKAHAGLPANAEVAASLAHALVHTGQCERAIAIMARALGSPKEASRVVTGWLLQRQMGADVAVGAE